MIFLLAGVVSISGSASLASTNYHNEVLHLLLGPEKEGDLKVFPARKPKMPKQSAVLGAYEEHLAALKRFVARLISPQDVDDVMQEAFLRAYRAEGDKPIEQAKSYLFRVAKNVALNQLRQKTRKPTDYLEDLSVGLQLGDEFTLEDEVLAQEKLGVHCAAVAALPPKCRRVYLMRKVYGMSYKEIAQTLGVSINTVEAHMEKGFSRCAAYIEARLPPTEDIAEAKARKTGE